MKKLFTIVAAAGAGYVAGLLMAPKSGKETREDIKKKAAEAKVVYGESAEKIKKGAGEVAHEASAFAKKAHASAGHVSKEASKLGVEAKRHLGKAAKSTSATARGVGQSASRLK